MQNKDGKFLEMGFSVSGKPRPKQSFKVSGKGKGFTPARIKSWQHAVGWAAKTADNCPKQPYPKNNMSFKVTIAFRLPDNVARDLDNLSKAVLDALSGVVWEDDKDVILLNLSKIVVAKSDGPGPGVDIQIWGARNE